MSKKLYVFEGSDGSGKTSVLEQSALAIMIYRYNVLRETNPANVLMVSEFGDHRFKTIDTQKLVKDLATLPKLKSPKEYIKVLNDEDFIPRKLLGGLDSFKNMLLTGLDESFKHHLIFETRTTIWDAVESKQDSEYDIVFYDRLWISYTMYQGIMPTLADWASSEANTGSSQMDNLQLSSEIYPKYAKHTSMYDYNAATNYFRGTIIREWYSKYLPITINNVNRLFHHIPLPNRTFLIDNDLKTAVARIHRRSSNVSQYDKEESIARYIKGLNLLLVLSTPACRVISDRERHLLLDEYSSPMGVLYGKLHSSIVHVQNPESRLEPISNKSLAGVFDTHNDNAINTVLNHI
jgi:thymidylate kinase